METTHSISVVFPLPEDFVTCWVDWLPEGLLDPPRFWPLCFAYQTNTVNIRFPANLFTEGDDKSCVVVNQLCAWLF